MQHIHTLRSGIDVMPAMLALKRNPHLWNLHTKRTLSDGTPHKEVDDIWLRYADGLTDPSKPHTSVWYDGYYAMPAFRELIFGICGLIQCEQLGGVLITRIAPGQSVKPHNDLGWHAEYYDKFALQLAAHPQQAFCYDDGQHVTAPGDLYWFNNQQTHWVTNDSPVERITMIVCCRVDKPAK